jgi:hypothetical protein
MGPPVSGPRHPAGSYGEFGGDGIRAQAGQEAEGGLVERRVLKDTAPQHVEYALTELGKTLQGPLTAICAWAAEHA